MHSEDWAATTQVLCRACCEGRPHQQHDHENKKPEWKRERHIAVAARDGNEVEAVFEAWPGEVQEWSVALER